MYKYCFIPKAVEKVYAKKDVNGDGEIDIGDVVMISAHYGRRTVPAMPYDVNEDGIVDYKDLAIVGANYGISRDEEILRNFGLKSAGDLVRAIDSADSFRTLSAKTGIGEEKLLRLVERAEIREAIPEITKDELKLLESLDIDSIEDLQKLKTDDESLERLHRMLMENWMAMGYEEASLPTKLQLKNWIETSKGITPKVVVDEGGVRFPDGSSVSMEGEEGASVKLTEVSVPHPRVLTPRLRGAAWKIEGLPNVEGNVRGFIYDPSTLKIRAEKLLELNVSGGIGSGVGSIIREIVIEGRMIDVVKIPNLGGGYSLRFSTHLPAGKWRLTPVYHSSDSTYSARWRGNWHPNSVVIEITETSHHQLNFTFSPVETTPPSITVSYHPSEPVAGDEIEFVVEARDDRALQKVTIYRYAEGEEPSLVGSWEMNFTDFRHRFTVDPTVVPPGGELRVEVGAWDWVGNFKVEVVNVKIKPLEFHPPALTVAGERYYIGCISDIIFSEDSDWENGELKASAYVEVVGKDRSKYRVFKVDYPYHKYFQANDRGDPDEKHPIVSPWVPVVAFKESEMAEIGGYSLHVIGFETDYAIVGFLRSFVGFLESLGDFIESAVYCIGSGGLGCVNLFCNLLSGEVLDQLRSAVMDDSDEYFGTAVFVTTEEAEFGRGESYEMYGNEGDENEFNGLFEGTWIEDVCEKTEEFSIVDQAASLLTSEGGKWIKVYYYPDLYETRRFGEIKVRFTSAYIYNDRNVGSCELDAYTFVGVVGGAPERVLYSVDEDTLASLPYSVAESRIIDVEDVDSGESIFPDVEIFYAKFSDPNVAMIHVEIALWDSDVGPDDDIGSLSISWPASKLWDIIRHPEEAGKYGDIRVQKIGDYYVIKDTRTVYTREYWRDDLREVWGSRGADISYEIWIKVV